MTDAAGDDATKESTTTTTTTSSTKVEKKEDSSDAAGIIRTYNNKERKSAIKYRHKRRVRRWCTIYSKESGLALEYLLQVGTAIPIPRDWVLRPLMEGRAGQGGVRTHQWGSLYHHHFFFILQLVRLIKHFKLKLVYKYIQWSFIYIQFN